MRILALAIVSVFLLALMLFTPLVIFTVIDAVPLEEITVSARKLPEFTFHQLYCNNKFRDVTEAGPHLKCLRTDI